MYPASRIDPAKEAQPIGRGSIDSPSSRTTGFVAASRLGRVKVPEDEHPFRSMAMLIAPQITAEGCPVLDQQRRARIPTLGTTENELSLPGPEICDAVVLVA
jgi:hypothetical protein